MKQLSKFLAGVCVGIMAASASAATHNVDITGFAFSPANADINQGDTVAWTERDGAFHSTASDSGLWDSGSLAQDSSFSFTFSTPGSYPYHCNPHPFMTGGVSVQAVANTPPTAAITSPTNNAVFNPPASVVIQATASDNGMVTQVQFFDGAASLGVDLTSPYSITSNLAVGIHNLTAVAMDDAGARGTSVVVTVKVPIIDPFPDRLAKGSLSIEVQTIADGMASPLGMALPDDGSGRMFVYDQAGLVYVVTAGGRLSTPLLDVRSRLVLLTAYDERGLLGMAAHPNFTQNPLIYTYTSEPNAGTADFPSVLPGGVTNNHQSVVAEWRIDVANSNRIDVVSRREILRIDKPQSNHNGGTMRFGPDGFLYISLGDGGAADDEGDGHSAGGNAQNTNNILGDIIRIDVDGTNSANGKYAVPSDNPFVGVGGVDEIYAYGLRNPFSFSFDRNTGALYLGDVGQNRIEEIDIIVKGGNYGWSVKEGSFFFDGNGAGSGFIINAPVRPVPPNLIDPIAEYDHDEGLAVVGGYVYRGSQVASLQGRYVFGDWGSFDSPSGRLFYLDAANVIKEFRLGLDDRPLGLWVKGFGEDASGELYVFVSKLLGPAGNTGRMLKLIPAPTPISLASITAGSGNATNQWTGGLGPFGLQQKQVVTEAFCGNVMFTTGRTAVVTVDAPTAFFRVTDAGREPPIPFSASLSGRSERPTPLTNTARGLGLFSLDGNTLRFDIQYGGLSGVATAAHIHGSAAASGASGVLIDLAPFNGGAFGSNGTLSGVVILSDAVKALMLAGLTYVNVHTTLNPGGEVRGQVAPVLMQACLNGLAERPAPLTNSATGSGTFSLVGSNLSFNITYSGLSGAATAAHIHGPATPSMAAGILVDLAPFNGGSYGAAGSVAGTIRLTPEQLAMVVDGLTYVNFHTSLNSGGELRGQIVAQAAGVPLTVSMSGLAERPTRLTNSAAGAATLSLEGDRLTFNVRYSGLSGVAVAGHIHGPASASISAGVLIDLEPYNGGSWGSAGRVSGSVLLSAAQKAMVLGGQTYLNLHTAANPGGEVRGQIAPVLMFSSLSGVNERPTSVQAAAVGSGTYALVWTNLSTVVTYSGLSGTATAAHIHGLAGLLQAAGILVDLAPFNGGAFGAFGSVAGIIPLSVDNLGNVVDLQTYVNFHTTVNPGGEIRGQISR